MSAPVEVVITSEATGQFCSVSVYDIVTGSQLMTYKSGGVIGSNALSFVGSDYIVGAETTKPLLHVWAVNSHEPTFELRTVCPGIIGALAVSPDGKYIVAGVAEKIHIWMVESGKLLGVVCRHFQPVTCIRFIEDGSHFVSAGQDGMVLVWLISDLVAQDGVRLDTVYSFQSHYLPVKDVFVGSGGSKTRIVSVSLDGTCRLYDFSSGKLLLSVIVDGVNLTSVTADVLESTLFLGTNSGDILSIRLQDRPRHIEHHVSDEERESVFKGHTKAVTCLSTSQNATELLSGSADETVRLWHIESKQCLRTIQHKGAVQNAFISFIPPQISAEKFKPSTYMNRLQRVIDNDKDNFSIGVLNHGKEVDFIPYSLEDNVYEAPLGWKSSIIEDAPQTDPAMEIDDLKQKNLALYKYAVDKILHSVNDEQIVMPPLVDIQRCMQLIKNENGIHNVSKRISIKSKSKKKSQMD